MRSMLIAGASRGIGCAVAEYFSGRTDDLYCVSRTEAPHGTWIEADLAGQHGIDVVSERLRDMPLGALLYVGGIWEKGAFTDAYRFDEGSTSEIDNILAVNLTAPIKLVRALLPNLRAAGSARVVFVGALRTAIDREVVYTASKFGLTGAAEAMQSELRQHHVSVTVVNPGNVGTDEVIEDIETGAFGPQTPIPVSDVVSAVAWALSLSNASVATEINLAQTDP